MAKYLFLCPLRFLQVESFFMRKPLGSFVFRNLMRAARLAGRMEISREQRLKKKYKMRLRYLNVEFTSHCNLRCKWCSLDVSRQKGYMKPAFWQYIIDYLVDNIKQGKVSIGELALHHAGETLVHPKVGEMLTYLGKAKRETTCFPFVTLLTNATVLNHRMSSMILKSDAIDYIRFSVDGGTKSSFENIRRGAKWESVLQNVNHFLKVNQSSSQKVRTGIIMIDTGQELAREFVETVKWWMIFAPDRHITGMERRNSRSFPAIRNLVVDYVIL